MDINNMKVTDLKKELKTRGLSIIGNKSELVSRLSAALQSDGRALDSTTNEDSALEEQLLGDESVADETISKSDEHLIDDLLDTNKLKDNTKEEPKQTTITNKSPPKITAITSEVKKSISTDKSITDLTTDANDSANTVRNTTSIKVLSAEERKQLRDQKFGNKLNERAQRFGLKSEKTTNSTSNIEEKLEKRAQRFGAIVSNKMKQMNDNQKLIQRKERFGINTTINVKNTTTTPTNTGSNKRKIFSSNDNSQKQKRLERFEKFL